MGEGIFVMGLVGREDEEVMCRNDEHIFVS